MPSAELVATRMRCTGLGGDRYNGFSASGALLGSEGLQDQYDGAERYQDPHCNHGYNS
jgi:hypothetical protein